MEKNKSSMTALAIFFVATAVVLIGGLVVVPTATTLPQAYAVSDKVKDKCPEHEDIVDKCKFKKYMP